MPVEIVPYIPSHYVELPRLAEVSSAWTGLDRILVDLLRRFSIHAGMALEFGVEFGYSTAALANLFELVRGVDTFTGDVHAGPREDHYLETTRRLKGWPNISLHQARYQDWIQRDESRYDLIHIDIVHTYEDTFACGRWAVDHASCVIFHDTESFPDVKRAVSDIADQTARRFYNYEACHGLGILVANGS
jgi:predicted O-methyltransferase YrrM